MPVTPAPSGQKWGRLILLDRIGEGTSCEVFRAWDTELHRDVALKLLHQDDDRDAHERVLEEARRMARVRHQHVVQVYGAETHDGRVGLWMELVRGESLEQILKDARAVRRPRNGGNRPRSLRRAGRRPPRAPPPSRHQGAERHARGGRPHRPDGLRHRRGARRGTNRLVGTPLYLAPEIFDGQKASIQSDVYSLGVLLFYLLTGAYPVTAATMEQLARAHLRRERKSLRDLRPDLPQNLVQTVERAMAFEPAQRFRSAGDMERALQEAIDVAAAPIVAAPVPVPVRRRRFGAMFVAAAVALIACVVGLTSWARTVQARRGATLAAVRSIAVMPTEHDPSSQVSDQFVRGFTDELLATFGQIQALTVKPGVGSGGAGRTSQEIARVLDVDALLTTTLSSDDGARDGTAPLVVRAQLVAAGTGAVIWTGRVERPRGASQRLQNELALAIASAVLPGKNVAVPPQRTTNPEAEVAYLLGRSHLDRYGAGSADLALKAFERARDIDPSDAAALVGAARARISMGLNGAIPHQQARTQALADVHKALAIDPNLAEGYATLAHISFIYDWNFQLAERNFQKALELNPSQSYARIYYAELLSALHRFDESIEQIELGRRLEPESAALVRRHALLDYYRGDFAAAERTLAVAVAMDPGSAGRPPASGPNLRGDRPGRRGAGIDAAGGVADDRHDRADAGPAGLPRGQDRRHRRGPSLLPGAPDRAGGAGHSTHEPRPRLHRTRVRQRRREPGAVRPGHRRARPVGGMARRRRAPRRFAHRFTISEAAGGHRTAVKS